MLYQGRFMRSVGIDIGSFSIKVAAVESTGKSYIVRDFVEIPYSHDLTHDRYIQTIDALRKIAAHFDPDKTKFNVSIAQEHICVRHINFPFRERFKILKSIAFELEDDIPYDQDEAIFEAKVLSHSGATSEVLALACPHHYIQEVIELCNEAGFDPDTVSMEAAALSNLIEEWDQSPQELNLTESSDIESGADEITELRFLLSIGYSKSLMCVYHGKNLLNIHTISHGGKDCIEAIATKYNLSHAEAVKTLHEKGFLLTNKKDATDDQIHFSNCIGDSLLPLIKEVRRFILSLNGEFNFKTKDLFVTGGFSQLINLAPYLTQNLEIACNVYKQLQKHPIVKIENTDAAEYRGGLAIGLAIEGIRHGKNPPVNFRKGELGKQSQLLSNIVKKWGYSIKMGAIALACLYIYGPMISSVSDSLYTDANNKLKNYAKKIGKKGRDARPAKLRTYLKQQKRQLKSKEMVATLSGLNSGLDVLNDISNILPNKEAAKIDIQKFNVDKDELEFKALLSSKEEAQLIRDSLKNYSSNQKVHELTPSRAIDGKTSVHLKIKIDRLKGSM